MSGIRIITDSACDIQLEEAKKLGIRIVSFPITFYGKNGVESFRERIEYTDVEFYEILQGCNALPTHARINQWEFMEEYDSFYKEGITDVIHVTINSKGSATYESAILAKNEFFEKHPDAVGKMNIHIVDSMGYSAYYGYPILLTAQKILDGAEIEQVLTFLHDWIDNIKIYLCVYSFEYAQKSGRIGSSTAFVGNLLGLRPIAEISNGEINVIAKAKGDKSAFSKISTLVAGKMEVGSPYMLIYGTNEKSYLVLERVLTDKIGCPPDKTFKIGAAISINSGPDVVAVAFRCKK